MAIEQASGDVERWLKGYIQHLTSADSGNFTSFTTPGTEDIRESIDASEAEILVWLSEAGYTTDISTFTGVAKRYLSWYNAIGAAYRLEMFHPGLQFANSPNTRFDRLEQIWLRLRDTILAGGITGIGVPVVESSAVKPRFTALTHAEKQPLEDPSNVQPYFKRRSFRHPGLSDSRGVTKDPAIR